LTPAEQRLPYADRALDRGRGSLPPGIYELRIAARKRRDTGRRRLRLEPPLSLCVRAPELNYEGGPYETLVWATDLRTGAPVAQAPVSLYANNSGAYVYQADTGVTDADGFTSSATTRPIWSR
jgi:hypothetical protein